MSGIFSPGNRIAIALGDRSVTAVVGGRDSMRTLAVSLGDAVSGDTVAMAFERLADRITAEAGNETAGARVHVALLPPLADARLVRLPPLRRSEAEAVIRRDAARHFLGGTSPRIISVISASNGEGNGNGNTAFLAAAAESAVVEAVSAAARRVGWRLEGVAPAHGAWLASAAGYDAVLAVLDDAVHILRMDGRRCTAVRRAPASLPTEILESVGPTPGRAMVFAETSARGSLTAVLETAGWDVDSGRLSTAVEVAAANVARSRLELEPPGVAAERVKRARRNAARAVATAGVLLVAAAAMELWGAHRELAAVQAERAAIRAEVEPLLATRDSIDTITRESETVRSLETTSPRWTRALFDLALLLPRDAFITSLHTVGDTVVVEATGASAGAALQALRQAGSLAEIRLVGTIERDLEDGATATERFRFSARLEPPVGDLPVSRANGEGGGP